ncbi:hypothetical protein SAMN04487760_10546 [Lachnospiraceae bacterium G41]|nr:hypothetical protein SAMN04487760_10546 [Lachnospiraceae bacterium G41]
MMKPTITLDMKKNRIRIHKNTLTMLDYPDYIYILVNPEKRKIAVCRANNTDKDVIHITSTHCSYCDIYSTELMEQISSLNENIISNLSYRLQGEKKNNYIAFDIRLFEIIK